jgi:hypothetical protein
LIKNKGIKKLANILFRLFAILVFLTVVAFLLLQQHAIQTYLAQRAAVYLSSRLQTRVDIGTVEISFFTKVILNDVYIEDQHKDTLLYAKKLRLGISVLDTEKRKLHVSDIVLLNSKASVIKYAEDKDFNFQFILDAFESKDTVKSGRKPWDISFGEVTLINTTFAYRNEHDTIITTGINFTDLEARMINGRFSDISVDKDTIFATTKYLSAVEKSGFILKSMSSFVKLSPTGLTLNELKLRTPQSNIATDLTLKYNDYDDLNQFIDSVRIKAAFDKSKLELSDIAYFAPELKGLFQALTISGKVSGKISDLKGKNLDITMGKVTQFRGDVTLTGLPYIEETLIYLNVDRLSTSYDDLRHLPVPPFEKHGTLQVPPSIAKLGLMHFKGTFTGLYNDFYAYGDFNTALGNLSSDISVHRDEKLNKPVYKGKLKSKGFNFGRFFDAPMLGRASGSVNVDGEGLTLEELTAKLEGNITSIDFNKYTYKNVAIEGNIAKRIFKGKLNVKDENIDFDFIGKVDLTGKMPALDFVTTLNKADLAALHFLNTTKKTNISTQLIINVTGNNIDNMLGQVNFDNTIYTQDDEVYKMSVFNLIAEEENGVKTVKLFSDFVDARVTGSFKILQMEPAVAKLLSEYLPSQFAQRRFAPQSANQNFEYSFLFKKTDAVTRLFVPKLLIAPKTQIKGKFNSAAAELSLAATSSRISYAGVVFNNWNASGKTNGTLQFSTGCERLYVSDSIYLNDFNIASNSAGDSVSFAMTWDNKTERKTMGDIKAFMHFDSRNKLLFKILPSEFSISDSLWSISHTNEVLIDSSHITVKDLVVEHGIQSIALNGVLSDNKKDQLQLKFTEFNLANFNVVTRPKGVTLKGVINGVSSITDFYNDLVFSSDNNFRDFSVNNNELGNGDVTSIWDNSKQALYLHGAFTLGIVPNILFSGYYYPKKEQDNLDLEVSLQNLRMELFEPFVKEYCSDFAGFFAGNLTVKGSLKEPKVDGIINVNARKVTVSYLKTSYKFTHDIVIQNTSFGVENMSVFDINNNKAVVTGKVYHDNFKNFQLDFDIQAQKFMCLNTTEADNPDYYGRAFASGIINIFGFLDHILIDANVRTEKVTSIDKQILSKANTELTKFYIPLAGTSEVSESNFITFVKKDTSIKVKSDYKVKLGGLTLNFGLEVTPDAEIQLIFDQKVGDVIKARGNGDIKLKISNAGDFKMYGDYLIENGDYLFTLQNVINKRFDIEKGGLIKWSGNPERAEVNLTAVYKPRASLKPFFPEDSTGIYKKRTPVDLKLLMTGNLLSPDINFNIGLPTVDASTRTTVLSYVNTEAEMNRQVFSLLILNSFVTPYQLTNSGAGPTVGSAVGANTSELLSNQLSNMLSKISNDFDVGVNYRPGDAISKDELEVALSTQLFDDRLVIDGNVSNNTNNQNPNNIVGDVVAEYKLWDAGKVRIKAFNKANDNSTQIYQSGNYTQGVGIFYREEFDTIGELYRRYLERINPKKAKQNASSP